MTAQELREQLGSLHHESGESGATSSPVFAQVPVLATPELLTAESLPIHDGITQAQALFDDGLIVQAVPRFASLAQELAGLGREHTEEAARCRFRIACCLVHLGHQEEALKDLLALADALRPCRPPDDRLLLDVRLQVGQLLLDLGDQRRISELAEVYRALTAAAREEDAAMTAEVRRALTRAALG